jgi:hypothetical protein
MQRADKTSDGTSELALSEDSIQCYVMKEEIYEISINKHLSYSH